MSYTIAIDLGGTIIKVGLLKEGHLVDHLDINAHASFGLKSELPELETAVDHILLSNELQKEDLLGIGFCFAGLVDSKNNRILSTNQKYDDGPAIDLAGWARHIWNCPLIAENDARMALLGEWQYGAGKGISDLVMITLGTGIGSAVLINGQLLRGQHFQAGNMAGHFVINHHGTLCTCGGIGCVESEASTWRLPSLLREHPGYGGSTMRDEEVPDFKALFYHTEKIDYVAC
jgi:glucokinase